MTYSPKCYAVRVIHWWVDSMLTPLITHNSLGEKVTLHVLFSPELSGNQGTSLRYQRPMES